MFPIKIANESYLEIRSDSDVEKKFPQILLTTVAKIMKELIPLVSSGPLRYESQENHARSYAGFKI